MRSIAGSGPDRRGCALTPPRRAVLASTLWAVATLPVLSRLVIGRSADDLKVFMNGADAVLHGPLVYRDVVFEYPPYALLWFLPPRALSHDLGSFRLAFGLEMWAADALVKALLLWHGVRHRGGLRDLTPFLAYSLGSAALGHLLLQRFDLIPAALTLGAALAVAGGSALLGGVLVAVGAGTKLYPALLVPVLGVFAWRHGRAGLARFTAGVALACAPLARRRVLDSVVALRLVSRGARSAGGVAAGVDCLGAALRRSSRGLGAGVESGGSDRPAGRGAGRAWAAVVGRGDPRVSRVGHMDRVASDLGGLATRLSEPWRQCCCCPSPRSWRPTPCSVLSFTCGCCRWRPSCCLDRRENRRSRANRRGVPPEALRAAWCIVAATLIVPVFYPSREYATGLGLWRTAVLVLRNGLLIYATVCLWVGVRKIARAGAV